MNPASLRYFYSKKSMIKAQFRIKSQKTTAANSQNSIPSLCQIKTPKSSRKIKLQGLPLMNDDFGMRKIEYKESFVMDKARMIKCQVSFTLKFCFITLYDAKEDTHYKLRLLKETGKSILNRFLNFKYLFKDYIFRDESQKFYLSAPFPSLHRVFYFIEIEPSKVIQPECEEQDCFLKQQIKNLDRTQFLYGIKDLNTSNFI